MDAPSPKLMLAIERVLAAPARVVFAGFSEATELAKWWGPQRFTIPSLDFEPCPGSAYRIEMQPPDGEAFYLTGVFRAFEPPVRLAFTFVWDPPDPDDVETLVDLSFRDLDGSTAVVLTQGPFRTDARVGLHRDGWTESFDRLERLLAAEAP